jgi:hypothetical protein
MFTNNETIDSIRAIEQFLFVPMEKQIKNMRFMEAKRISE